MTTMIADELKIYPQMNARVEKLIANMKLDSIESINGETIGDSFHLPLPSRVNNYISLRRDALSTASCRAEDTLGTHLTWVHYHMDMMKQTELVDTVAWEMLYQKLAASYATSIEEINCLHMAISGDPAKPYVRVAGVKPMHMNEKTTPEFVAYANRYAESYDWDLAELYPPALALSFEEVSMFDDMVKQMFGGDTMSFFDVANQPSGDDVSLA